MSALRSILRIGTVFALLAWLAVDMLLRPVRDVQDGTARVHRYSRWIVRVLGIECEVSGAIPSGSAVVANHVSYLDIFLFASVRPFIMVAKSEVRGWPMIGWIVRNAGTVFVVRGGGPATYPAVNRAMAEAYRVGLPVLFFPEGTTSDGTGVLPFRRGLFHSVLSEEVSLYAAALRFEDKDASWCGDALLLPHLYRMAAREGLRARMCFGGEVHPRTDRFTLSAAAQEQVAQMVAGLSQQAALAEAAEDLFDRPVERLGALDGHGCVLR